MKRKPPRARCEKLIFESRLPDGKVVAKCDCGRKRICHIGSWNRGSYKACKPCMKKIMAKRCHERFSKGRKGLENRLLGAYVASANRRGHEFTLTREEFFTFTKEKCHYCHIPPSGRARKRAKKNRLKSEEHDFLYTGIDRVDSNKGYTLENCVPCCGDCNRAKILMTYDEFLAYIERFRVGGVNEETRRHL
jgi:hypothetical protein